jgi:hypothetical protein
MRDDLEGTRTAVTDTFDKFWVIPEGDIREMLARTRRKIGRAVDMLKESRLTLYSALPGLRSHWPGGGPPSLYEPIPKLPEAGLNPMRHS